MPIMQKERKTIFVGVSGGVDSSVSAAVLQEQGHEVVGVFIKTWQPEWIECTWRDERRDAMRVCAHLDIPFVELDLEKEYKEGVADYMIREYRAGRTPNPDVMCNREVKFGGFLKWALEHGADAVATGHYAQITDLSQGETVLLRGNDSEKDQSYFLWTLTQEQLQQVVFPVGHLPKVKVRKLARKYQLPTAVKKDSQGICFIGQIDMKDFLRHYIDEKSGEVLDKNGIVIGYHHGALFFTLGERHGFTITEKGTDDRPYYVVHKNIENNTITVEQRDIKNTPRHEGQEQFVKLHAVNDTQKLFQKGFLCEAQIRYHGEVKQVTFHSYHQDTNEAIITFHAHDSTVASGQSIVFYDGDRCLGGGIVE